MHTDIDPVEIGNSVAARIDDFLDGFVLVGFVAGTDTPVVVSRAEDRKTRLALNTLLLSACTSLNAPKP